MNNRDELEKLDHIPYSNKMMKYKCWPIVDVMPDGWVIDKTVGSPLSGHDFITNCKSVLNGQMRALLRVKSLPSGISQLTKPKPMVISEPTKHVDQVIDRDYVKTVNDLARAKFKKKMLSDILCDMQICEIEGWCKLDYLNEIRELINNLCADVVVSELKKSEAAVPEGFKVVPVEPTTEQFGGMARDVIQWMRFTESKNQHSESLVKWLKDMGNEIPEWLYSESEINHLSKHVISKGTIAAIIYKAMLAAAPEQVKGGE